MFDAAVIYIRRRVYAKKKQSRPPASLPCGRRAGPFREAGPGPARTWVRFPAPPNPASRFLLQAIAVMQSLLFLVKARPCLGWVFPRSLGSLCSYRV
mmetsp:Transcript_50287/g.132142  ORF Transcript_50287/g.132142 Transcript_50287/m.132142 type:complete len:97 (-) Transcript_50287:59-349(-)